MMQTMCLADTFTCNVVLEQPHKMIPMKYLVAS
jgi:hypothetical protein